MALPRLEDFAGASATLDAGLGWLQVMGAVSRDGTGRGSGPGGDNFIADASNTYDNDQFSQLVYLSGNSPEPQVRGSGSGATASCYFTYSGGGSTGIGKFVNNVFTDKGSVVSSLTGNDQFRLEASGTGFTLKKNGATIHTATDASLTSGAAGPGMDLATVDDWEGGNLAAPAITMVRPFSRGPWRRRRTKAAALGNHGPQARSALGRAFVDSTSTTQNIALTPVVLRLAAPATTLAVGAATVALSPVVLRLSAPSATTVKGSVTVAVSPTALRLAVPATTLSSVLAIPLSPAVLRLAVPSQTMVPGARSVALSATVLRLALPAQTLVPGARSVALSSTVLRLAVPAHTTTLGQSVQLTPVALRLVAPTTTLVPGAVSLALDPATLRLAVPPHAVTGGAEPEPPAAPAALGAGSATGRHRPAGWQYYPPLRGPRQAPARTEATPDESPQPVAGRASVVGAELRTDAAPARARASARARAALPVPLTIASTPARARGRATSRAAGATIATSSRAARAMGAATARTAPGTAVASARRAYATGVQNPSDMELLNLILTLED